MKWLAAVVVIVLLVVDYLYYDEFGRPPQIERFLESLTTGDSQATPAPERERILGSVASGSAEATPTRDATTDSSASGSVGCPSPPCAWDYAPAISKVSWEQTPRMSADGSFSFVARIDEGHTLTLPGIAQRGVSNVSFVTGPTLHGSVVPPARAGYSWDPVTGQYIAHTYDYADNTLTVGARVSGSLYEISGLEVCLWSGGTVGEAYILDCTRVEKE